MIIGFTNWLQINAFQGLITYIKVPCSLDLKIPAAYLLPWVQKSTIETPSVVLKSMRCSLENVFAMFWLEGWMQKACLPFTTLSKKGGVTLWVVVYNTACA